MSKSIKQNICKKEKYMNIEHLSQSQNYSKNVIKLFYYKKIVFYFKK